MIRTLSWKEYREQRGAWLLMAAVAALLMGAPSLLLAPAGQGTVERDPRLSEGLLALIQVVAVAYGLFFGSRALAGENETGTLAFLDAQAGRRWPLWRTKALTGAAFALALAWLLASMVPLCGLRAPGIPTGAWFWILPALVLDGFVWGLAGSALARSTLAAVLAGAALLGGSWLVTLAVAQLARDDPGVVWGSRAAFAAVAPAVSALLFCRPDRLRRAAGESARPAAWRVLLWLVYRQGRAEAALMLCASLAMGVLLARADQLVWSVALLTLGAVCGAAAFGRDQTGEVYRFLGAVRLPPWQVWSAKGLCWLAWSALAVLAGCLGVLLQYAVAFVLGWKRGVGGLIVTEHLRASGLSAAALLLYGFAVGLIVGKVVRWRVLAEFVAAALSLMGVVWLPSLYLGGLPLWTLWVPPLLLLAASRLFYWPWAAGRLASWRVALILGGASALATGWTAGVLWQRVAEVPDVGEPFDRAAFERSLDDLRGNAAGSLVREAVKGFAEARKRAFIEMVLLPKDPAGQARAKAALASGAGMDLAVEEWFNALRNQRSANRVLKAAIKNGPEQDRLLDLLFAGDWAAKVHEAAAMPPGMLQDPREPRSTFRETASIAHSGWEISEALVSRAAQLLARGESGAALDRLLDALALSRHLRNKAPANSAINLMSREGHTFSGVEEWLARVGPHRELLSRALAGLTKHEAEAPPLTDNIKADYFAYTHRITPDDYDGGRLAALARSAPWEKARAERLLDLEFACRLFGAGVSFLDAEQAKSTDEGVCLYRSEGGAVASVAWPSGAARASLGGMYLSHYGSYDTLPEARAYRESRIRALILVAALGLYETEVGKPAERLENLVPRYFKALPLDPFSGREFGYRVSTGERLLFKSNKGESTERAIPSGQRVLWSVGPDRIDHGGRRDGARSMLQDPPRWAAEELDLIYLVPTRPE